MNKRLVNKSISMLGGNVKSRLKTLQLQILH